MVIIRATHLAKQVISGVVNIVNWFPLKLFHLYAFDEYLIASVTCASLLCACDTNIGYEVIWERLIQVHLR
jgi:hypothetical protein